MFKLNKISSKLALSLAVFGICYVSLLVMVFVIVELPKTKKAIELEIEWVVNTFTQSATRAVFDLDSDMAYSVLSGLEQHPYVLGARIDNEYQVMLADISFERTYSSEIHFLEYFIELPEKKTYYRSLRDDRFNEGLHGSLLVDVSLHKAIEPAYEKIRSILLANVFQYVTFTVIVYLIVYWLVAKRVAAINDSLSSISATAPDNARVPHFNSRDEVAELAEGINEFIDSTERYLSAKNSAEQGLLYLTGHLEDVIKKRTADLELEKESAEKARDEAFEANRAKSVFLSNMSHELRTPLNAILGFTDRLLKSATMKLNEREADALERVHDNGKYLLNLINDLLDIARIEADRMVLNVEEFALDQLLSECCSKLAALAEEKNLSMRNYCDMEVFIEADRRKIEQVVINLLANAIKYTVDGWIKLSVIAHPNQIEIQVEDSGIGIKKEDITKIFDPYNHIHSNLNQEVSIESTGLGLPLVKKIVDLHQGNIQVSSIPGQGSSFKVSLPYKLDGAVSNQ